MEELLSKNSPSVVELIKKINSVRQIDDEQHIDLACDLFDMAQELGNEDLKDYASCTLGDACCQNDQFAQALFYINAGIDGLKKTDEYILISRAYNELGLIYRSQGHVIKSLENYMLSIDMAREHRLYIQEAITCSNFAALCEEMGANYQALEYRYRAIECCEFIEDEVLRDELLASQYAYMVKLYTVLKDYDQAKLFMNEIDQAIARQDGFEETFDIAIGKWSYYNAVGDQKNNELYKKECTADFYECTEYVVYYDELVTYVNLMLKDREFTELQKIFDRIDDIEINDEMMNLHLHIATSKIAMYKELGDRDSMMMAGYEYYTYNSRKIEDSKKSFVTTLRLKSELAQQKTTNLFLSAAAQTDILTGLANRSKLNTVIDELFIMASKDCKSLGVEMMDVDYFKHINDNYGHAKGDALLSSMGKFFRKNLVTDRVFIARYGGDEFVLYYYDMTDEEILEVAEKIQNQIPIIGKELEIGDVSVSQGIVNNVPEPSKRAWDYLNVADYALYFVKEHGKASIKLVHGRADLAGEDKKD